MQTLESKLLQLQQLGCPSARGDAGTLELALSCGGKFLLRSLFCSLLASACSLQTQTVTEEDQGRLLFLLIHPTSCCLFVLEEHLSPRACPVL